MRRLVWRGLLMTEERDVLSAEAFALTLHRATTTDNDLHRKHWIDELTRSDRRLRDRLDETRRELEEKRLRTVVPASIVPDPLMRQRAVTAEAEVARLRAALRLARAAEALEDRLEEA